MIAGEMWDSPASTLSDQVYARAYKSRKQEHLDK